MSHEFTNIIELCQEYDGDDQQFATIVREGRKALGKTQEFFATEFQVAISTISRWEAAKNMPHPAVKGFVVNRICDWVGTAKREAKPSGAYGSPSSSGNYPAVAAKSGG